MNILKYASALLFTTITLVHAANAQSADTGARTIQTQKRWQLELNATQLSAGEIRLQFLRPLSSRFGLGFLVGYRVPAPSLVELIKSAVGNTLWPDLLGSDRDYFANSDASAYMLGISARHELNAQKRTFIQYDLFHRHWNLPDNSFTDYINGTRIEERSHENVWGFKLLLGKEWTWSDHRKLGMGLCTYVGAGLRFADRYQEMTIAYPNNPVQQFGGHDQGLRPSLQLGINLLIQKRK